MTGTTKPKVGGGVTGVLSLHVTLQSGTTLKRAGEIAKELGEQMADTVGKPNEVLMDIGGMTISKKL